MTQSWKTIPNRTAGKIKLTPPAYYYTILLLISGLNFSLPTQSWLQQGGFRYWQVSGLAISSVAACFSSANIHSVDFASFQPIRSQHIASRLILYYNLFLPVHPPTTHPMKASLILHFPCTKHVPFAKFFHLIWRELLWAAVSVKEALKHSDMVHLLGKFRSCAHNFWLVNCSALKSWKSIIL